MLGERLGFFLQSAQRQLDERDDQREQQTDEQRRAERLAESLVVFEAARPRHHRRVRAERLYLALHDPFVTTALLLFLRFEGVVFEHLGLAVLLVHLLDELAPAPFDLADALVEFLDAGARAPHVLIARTGRCAAVPEELGAANGTQLVERITCRLKRLVLRPGGRQRLELRIDGTDAARKLVELRARLFEQRLQQLWSQGVPRRVDLRRVDLRVDLRRVGFHRDFRIF